MAMVYVVACDRRGFKRRFGDVAEGVCGVEQEEEYEVEDAQTLLGMLQFSRGAKKARL